MMKISKPTQWALIVGISAILLVSAGVVYSRQKAEQNELNYAITQANQDFIKYSAQKKELENRQSEANSRIASAQSEFRRYTDYIEIDEALFQAAKDAGVTITVVSSSLAEEENLSGITYRVFALTVTAEGEPGELLLFSKKLIETFSSAAIKSVKIEGGGGEIKPQIILALKIYAYGK